MKRRYAATLAAILVLLSGCAQVDPHELDPVASPEQSSSGAAPSTSDVQEEFPDIVSVEITGTGDGIFSLAVTVSSPYDTPDRYADGWRVLDSEGDVIGEHKLTHDHASEQPFTRTQTGVKIPAEATSITVEGRDQVSGYGGKTITVLLPQN